MPHYRADKAGPGAPVPDGELYDAGTHPPEHLPCHRRLHQLHPASLCHLPTLLRGKPQKVPPQMQGLRDWLTLRKFELEFHTSPLKY